MVWWLTLFFLHHVFQSKTFLYIAYPKANGLAMIRDQLTWWRPSSLQDFNPINCKVFKSLLGRVGR